MNHEQRGVGEAPRSAARASLRLQLETEAAMTAAAAQAARCWGAAALKPLLIGLHGDLGSGKTTWTRAMLRGLGYTGRVPSPTYTLIEHYALDGLRVAHLDLYRLADEQEIENLGIRDTLDGLDWLLVEWPERAPALAAACDLTLHFEIAGESVRDIALHGLTEAGERAVRVFSDLDSSKAL